MLACSVRYVRLHIDVCMHACMPRSVYVRMFVRVKHVYIASSRLLLGDAPGPPAASLYSWKLT